MTRTKAARGSGNYQRAKVSTTARRTRSIVSDYEQATLVGGLLIAVAFGLMFLYAAVVL